MKHCSKYYNPNEKEFLKLAEGFQQWIKLEEAANRTVPAEAYNLQKLVNNTTEKIDARALGRIESEQKKEEKEAARRAKATGSCPRCQDEQPVTVISEIKIPKTGYTHDVVKCTVCKKEFTQKRPNNPTDTVKWFHNFIKELQGIEPDGRPRWQHYGRTEADLDDLKQFYEKMKQAQEEEREAYRLLVEADAALDKALQAMTNQLLLLRVKQQQWSAGDAKA